MCIIPITLLNECVRYCQEAKDAYRRKKILRNTEHSRGKRTEIMTTKK